MVGLTTLLLDSRGKTSWRGIDLRWLILCTVNTGRSWIVRSAKKCQLSSILLWLCLCRFLKTVGIHWQSDISSLQSSATILIPFSREIWSSKPIWMIWLQSFQTTQIHQNCWSMNHLTVHVASTTRNRTCTTSGHRGISLSERQNSLRSCQTEWESMSSLLNWQHIRTASLRKEGALDR